MLKVSKFGLPVAMGLLLGASATQAAMVDTDGNTATGITDLEIDQVLYDVNFTNMSPADIYGDPPDFNDFDTEDKAVAAVDAVNTVLNAETGVELVGESSSTGSPDFRVAYDIVGVIIGNDNFRQVRNIESTTGNPPDDQWDRLPDFDEFPFIDQTGSFADFSNPRPVPLPAAVWLLGSGLLGLIGIARRKKA